MSVAVATTRVACNTSTGNQTITTNDLGGLTPVAALLIVSFATADGVAADHAMLSVGAVTGASNRWTAYMSDEHAAATSDSYNGSVATKCIRIISPLDGTVDGEADFSAWVSEGITINWTDAPAAAYLLTVIFFAGTDVTAHANSVALGNTVDVAVDITAPGFRPVLVITALVSQLAELSLGFVQENGAGTVTQRAVTSVARDGQATMQNLTAYRNDAGIIEIGVGGALIWYGEFNTFDSQGFSVTPRTAGAASRTLNYLALSFGGAVSTWVGTHTTPTSTNAAYADTGPNFKPQFVLLMPSLNEVQATVATDSRAFSWGLSALDADEQYATSISSEDAAADGNTQSLSDNVAVSLPNHAGALDIEATLVSFDTTGWTLNYSNITATAKLWPALAIQEFVASAGHPTMRRWGGIPGMAPGQRRIGRTW